MNRQGRHERQGLLSKYDAFDAALFEFHNIEVEQEAELKVASFEVVDDLSLMYGVK